MPPKEWKVNEEVTEILDFDPLYYNNLNESEKKYEWYGVDLDGTLVEYHGEERGLTFMGKPIPKTVDYVKKMIDEGKEVRIFTARIGKVTLSLFPKVTKNDVIKSINEWCLKHIGKILIVTNEKDYGMVSLRDDRCIQVIPNTGEIVKAKDDI